MLSVEVADRLRHFVMVEHRLGRSKSTREVEEALFDQVFVQRHIAICFAFLTARFRCDVNAPMSVHRAYVLASQLRDFRNARASISAKPRHPAHGVRDPSRYARSLRQE